MSFCVRLRQPLPHDDEGEPKASWSMGEEGLLTLGRSDRCDAPLLHVSISRVHASIRREGGGYVLRDEGSENGTFVDGERLARGVGRILRQGNVIRLGKVELDVDLEATRHLLASGQASQLLTDEAARSATDKPLDTREWAFAEAQKIIRHRLEHPPRVVVTSGPDEGKTLVLREIDGARYLVGRGHGVQLPLADASASRHHLLLVERAQALWVQDLGSPNGTLLAGERLRAQEQREWRAGEELRAGRNVFRFEKVELPFTRAAYATGDDDSQQGLPPSTGALTNSQQALPDAEPISLRVPLDAPGHAATGGRGPAPWSVLRWRSWTATDWLVLTGGCVVAAASVIGVAWLLLHTW